MKITSITPLAIPEIKAIRFARYADERGYFTETMRLQQLNEESGIPYLKIVTWQQMNESYSYAHVVRGLHFQWNNHMGKLVRALEGTFIDLILDIRLNSNTFGKMIGYELHYSPHDGDQEWLWIPPGFAHGFASLTDCRMEYACTSSWSPETERAITIFDPHIDWTLMEAELRTKVHTVLETAKVAEKDRNGLMLEAWKKSSDATTYMQTLPKV